MNVIKSNGSIRLSYNYIELLQLLLSYNYRSRILHILYFIEEHVSNYLTHVASPFSVQKGKQRVATNYLKLDYLKLDFSIVSLIEFIVILRLSVLLTISI